jgi:Domain of unknown function (DUF4345)
MQPGGVDVAIDTKNDAKRGLRSCRPERSNLMSGISSKAFGAVLLVLGIISSFVAVNVAFGGLDTLGWQGPSSYYEVTDDDAFAVRDSHARFFGGVYLGIGLFLILAASNVQKYRQGLSLVFALVFLGGLARLTQLDLDTVLGTDLLASTVVELVGMPLLFVWLHRLPEPSVSARTGPTPAPV